MGATTRRTVEGQQYAIHCRRPRGGGPDDEQILLDENALAAGHDYFSLGGFEISPDHRLLAYSVDFTGGERYTLRFRDLETGADLADVVDDVTYGLAWADDARTCFYVRPDDAMRPYEVWRHALGTPAADDVLVFREDDERFFIDIGRTRCGRFVLIESSSKLTSETWFVPTAAPDAARRAHRAARARARVHASSTTANDTTGDRFLIVTNADGARNFKLVAAPVADPGREQLDASSSRTATTYASTRVNAFARPPRAHRTRRRPRPAPRDARSTTATVHDAARCPIRCTACGSGRTPSTTPRTLRYGYTSLVAPVTDLDYDPSTDASHGREACSRCSAATTRRAYTSARLWADGDRRHPRPDLGRAPARHSRSTASRPALLVRLRRVRASRATPRSARRALSLLDRGFVFAIAHVRGGGEMGRGWYEDGRLEHKANTFTDFIACAEHLVAQRLHVAGAARRPRRQRGRAAHGRGREPAARPLRRRSSPRCRSSTSSRRCSIPTLPLTDHRVGGVGRPAGARRVRAHEGVLALRQRRARRPYPAMLVTTGLNDPRVQYWEPAKWVAKLRAHTTSDNPILLRTEMGAGHGGPSGRYDAWRDEATVLAFVCESVGITGVSVTSRPAAAAPTTASRSKPSCDRGAGAARRLAVVLCHPHPQYGGTHAQHRDLGAVRGAARRPAIPCLRFNFRGVEGSDGEHYAKASDEPLDVVAAIDAAGRRACPARRSRSSAGRSAPTSRSRVVDARVAGWVAIAPPLRFGRRFAGGDRRRARSS